MPAGQTLEVMVRAALPGLEVTAGIRVFIADQEILETNWSRVRPKPGVMVNVRVVPVVHGGFLGGGGEGGGKSPLRTILTIAVLGAAIAFGGPLGAGLFGASAITVLGATVSTATIGSAIIGLAGTLLVNAIAPVRSSKYNALSATAGTSGSTGSAQKASPTLTITGTRNEPRPFSVIPSPLGRHRMTPPLGALPYTEILQSEGSDDQFLRLVVVWGEGPLLIEDKKIAETPLSDFQEVEIYDRQGFEDDPPLTLFTNDVFEEQFSVLLSDEVGWVSRTATPGSNSLSVDVVFPKGLVEFTDEGDKTNYSVNVDVQYAPVGTENWVGGGGAIAEQTSPPMPAETGTKQTSQGDLEADNPRRIDLVVLNRADGTTAIITGPTATGQATPEAPTSRPGQIALAEVFRDTTSEIQVGDITDVRPSKKPFGANDFICSPTTPASDAVTVGAGTLSSLGFSVTAKQTEAVRRSIIFAVGAAGDYKVRMKRTTPEADDSQILDEVRWTALRTFAFIPPFDATGLATTELRIKANDQLNRVIDQLNGIVTRICLDWDKAASKWVLRPTRNNASLGRYVLQGAGNPNPRSDEELDLDAFAYWHERCEAQGFTFDMVRDFPSNVADTFQDVASASMATLANHDGRWTVVIDEPGKLPVQHFTPRNSREFSFERNYPEEVHAWRMRFPNEEDNYRLKELLVYADGYNADGSAGKTQATKFEELEQVGITNVDLLNKIGRRRIAEGIARQERYTFTTDIESIVCTRGDTVLLSTTVISVGLRSGRIASLLLDESDDVEGVTIDERVSMEAGKQYGITARSPALGEVVIPVTTIPSDGTNVLMFESPLPQASAPVEDDLFSYGERERETIEVALVGMSYNDQQGARISAVPYAQPAIEQASDGSFPEFGPPITAPPGEIVPFVVGVRSDESVLRRLPSGLLQPQIRLTLGRPSSTLLYRLRGVEVQYRERDTSDLFRSVTVDRQYSLEVDLPEVEQGLQYEIKLRYILVDDDGPFSSFYYETVIGMATPPPDIQKLVLEGQFLRWDYPAPPIDFRGFQVRSTSNLGAPFWTSAVPAHDGILDKAELDLTNVGRGQRVFLVKAFDVAGNESVKPARLIRDLGDPLVTNVVAEHSFRDAAWPGTVTNGFVQDGSLWAQATTLYLDNDGEAYLPTNSDPYLEDDEYLAMTYETVEYLVPESVVPSRLLTEVEPTGQTTIEYQAGEHGIYLPNNNDPYLPVDGDPYLPAVFDGVYRIFPSFLNLAESGPWKFRVRTAGGSQRGILDDFTLVFDVEDEEEAFPDFIIPPQGARLPVTKDFRWVSVINYTQQDDGGDATQILVMDKGIVEGNRLTAGPRVQAFDNNGQSTQGFADFTIQGAKL